MLLYGQEMVDKDGDDWSKDTTEPSTNGKPNKKKGTCKS